MRYGYDNAQKYCSCLVPSGRAWCSHCHLRIHVARMETPHLRTFIRQSAERTPSLLFGKDR